MSFSKRVVMAITSESDIEWHGDPEIYPYLRWRLAACRDPRGTTSSLDPSSIVLGRANLRPDAMIDPSINRYWRREFYLTISDIEAMLGSNASRPPDVVTVESIEVGAPANLTNEWGQAVFEHSPPIPADECEDSGERGNEDI